MDLQFDHGYLPNIPLHIVHQFGKKFEKADFIKPDILEITGVEVYKDNEKDKKAKKLKELELKQLELKLDRERQEREAELIKKVRDEEKRRSIDFEQKLKEKLNEARENLIANKRKRAEEKKQKIGFGSVAKSMSSLIRRIEDVNDKNQIITPDSSDLEESPRTEKNRSSSEEEEDDDESSGGGAENVRIDISGN